MRDWLGGVKRTGILGERNSYCSRAEIGYPRRRPFPLQGGDLDLVGEDLAVTHQVPEKLLWDCAGTACWQCILSGAGESCHREVSPWRLSDLKCLEYH